MHTYQHLLPRMSGAAAERFATPIATAIVVVEQYPRAVLAVADRGYVLHGGKVVLDVSGAELLDRVEDIEATYFGRSSVTKL
jgi:ABC-type branched-subunit amino acid transport system ATPase component